MFILKKTIFIVFVLLFGMSSAAYSLTVVQDFNSGSVRPVTIGNQTIGDPYEGAEDDSGSPNRSMFHLTSGDGLIRYAEGFDPLDDAVKGIANMIKLKQFLEENDPRGGCGKPDDDAPDKETKTEKEHREVEAKDKKKETTEKDTTEKETTEKETTGDNGKDKEKKEKSKGSAIKDVISNSWDTVRDHVSAGVDHYMQTGERESTEDTITGMNATAETLSAGGNDVYMEYTDANGRSYKINTNKPNGGNNRTIDGDYNFISPGNFVNIMGEHGSNPWSQMFNGGYEDILSGDIFICGDGLGSFERDSFGIPNLDGTFVLGESFTQANAFGDNHGFIGQTIGDNFEAPLTMTLGEFSNYFTTIGKPLRIGDVLNDPIIGEDLGLLSLAYLYDVETFNSNLNDMDLTTEEKLTLALTMADSTINHLSNADAMFDRILLSDLLNSELISQELKDMAIGYFADSELLEELEKHAEHFQIQEPEQEDELSNSNYDSGASGSSYLREMCSDGNCLEQFNNYNKYNIIN